MTAETVAAEVEAESDKTQAERLIFFSDAVIAIAITLLALELPIPAGPTVHTTAEAWHSFGANWDDYLSFLISFVVIANQWFAHHWLYRYVNRVHRRLAGINMVWLLTIVVTPFATRVLVGDTPFPMAFTLYAGIQVVSQVTFLAMTLVIRRDHLLSTEVPRGTFAPAMTRSISFAVAFLISIPLSYVTHWAFAFWAFTPTFARIFIALMRRGNSPAYAQPERSKPAAS
jgi:uncharacterized membrane protein